MTQLLKNTLPLGHELLAVSLFIFATFKISLLASERARKKHLSPAKTAKGNTYYVFLVFWTFLLEWLKQSGMLRCLQRINVHLIWTNSWVIDLFFGFFIFSSNIFIIFRCMLMIFLYGIFGTNYSRGTLGNIKKIQVKSNSIQCCIILHSWELSVRKF